MSTSMDVTRALRLRAGDDYFLEELLDVWMAAYLRTHES